MQTHKKKIGVAVALIAGLMTFAAVAATAPKQANACYFSTPSFCK